MTDSHFVNNDLVARPLKGLLMDKGGMGNELKIHNVLRKMQLIQEAMERLVSQQRASREAAQSECIELYLATNLRSQSQLQDDFAILKNLPTSNISYEHTRRPIGIEWRARRDFTLAYQYPNTARINAFNPNHKHYIHVREYVEKRTPSYYEVLAGYDAVRVTLNNSLKSLRKTILDLSNDETRYPVDVVNHADKLSRRIFKQLPNSEALANVLHQLYFIESPL